MTPRQRLGPLDRSDGAGPDCGRVARAPRPRAMEVRMSWKKPRVVEICLALEINGYALATI
jgi:coenzyme PQQ precursor peptide PqqA